jgi:hypothetical protein
MQNMNITLRLIVFLISCSILAMSPACTEKKTKVTGFLSDYTRLERTNGSLRYINIERLATYSRFIINPVKFQPYHKGKSGPDQETRTALTNYMHQAVINALVDRYMIVSQPGPGIAIVDIAITDIEDPVQVMSSSPLASISGKGAGSVSLEAEVLDSQTYEQIGALIESQKGKRVSLKNLKKWEHVKSVMDDWAKKFRERLDEAHGYRD